MENIYLSDKVKKHMEIEKIWMKFYIYQMFIKYKEIFKLLV